MGEGRRRANTDRAGDRTGATVIHVAEAWGGGIVDACEWIASQSPGSHHTLIYVERDGVSRKPDPELFERAIQTDGRLAMARTIRSELKRSDNAVIHAHSSWAGLLSRIVNGKAPVVYSPHCFAFERVDIGTVTRTVFQLIERAGAQRTAVLIANGGREAQTADSLGYRRVVNLPMVGRREPDLVAAKPGAELTTIGRIASQKDPGYFVELRDRVQQLMGREISARWIGGVDLGFSDSILRDAGVEITGWLTPPEVLEWVADSGVYVHTAAWEAGVPLSIFDAASLEIPVLVRAIPSLEWSAFPSYPDIAAHAEAVAECLRSTEARKSQIKQTVLAAQEIADLSGDVDLCELYRDLTNNQRD